MRKKVGKLIVSCLLLVVVIFSTQLIAKPTEVYGQQPEEERTIPPNEPENGLIYDGLRIDAACPGGYAVGDTKLCTHGPDPAPKDVDITKSVEPIPDKVEPEPTCAGNPTTGNRTEVIYARASDRPDRFAEYVNTIRRVAQDASGIYSRSALHTGSMRSIRFVYDSNCYITIRNVVMSPTGDDNFGNTLTELQAQGFKSQSRKYLVFVDANIVCGLGSVAIDDRPTADNRNNFGPSYARIDSGCWIDWIVAHEHMHNLGGVQLSAPYSSGGYHCVDEYDVMCYSDSPYFPGMQYLCPDSMRDSRYFDCNNNDYFHTNPPANSYLATHWNTAMSKFLVIPPNKPVQLAPSNEATITSQPITFSWINNGDPDNGPSPLLFFLHISKADNSWSTYFTESGTSLSITLPSVGRYCWHISVFDGENGESTPQWCFNLQAAPPLPPSNLSAIGGDRKITINWQDNSTNETGFRIYRWDGGIGQWVSWATVGTNITQYVDLNLNCNWTYFYLVSAYNNAGESERVGWVQATVNDCPVAAPSNFAAQGQYRSIKLTWQDNSNNEENFRLYRWDYARGEFLPWRLTGANVTEYIDTNLSCNETNYYMINAINSVSESPLVGWVQATVASC